MKIVICDELEFASESLALIRETAAPDEVVVTTKDRLAGELADAEIFFGFHTPEVFRHASSLRWIQTTSAGLDKILKPELVERGLLVTNASGVHAPSVVEVAWALTLAVARGIPDYVRQQQQHLWKWAPLHDLKDATAGVIGLGGIGRRYANVAAAFGMRVRAVDLHQPPQPAEVESLWGIERLDELLALSDVVLVSCPYTPQTHYLIEERRLACMKPTAILINIARGGIVQETALAAALRAGRIAGAGLDVCETEPLPADSPLWDVPNLLITAHCAGLSSRRMHRLAEFFCQNLRRYRSQEPLLNLVDQTRGYPVP